MTSVFLGHFLTAYEAESVMVTIFYRYTPTVRSKEAYIKAEHPSERGVPSDSGWAYKKKNGKIRTESGFTVCFNIIEIYLLSTVLFRFALKLGLKLLPFGYQAVLLLVKCVKLSCDFTDFFIVGHIFGLFKLLFF